MNEKPAKRDIRQLDPEQIRHFFVSIGEKPFRAKQVYEWLWKKSAKDFDQMTNLSLATRKTLKAHFEIKHIKVDSMQRSEDGTIKNAVKLHDGLVVESVLIPAESRMTACISSQVGCSLDCHFCATARLKRMRNLNPDEIYDQVVAIKEEADEFFAQPLTNIVYMGMGEPLLNYRNVMRSIEKITSPEGLGMSPGRITLSTVGLPKMIERMADEAVRFNLAVSLHAAIDETRSLMMPVNEKSNLDELARSLQYWYRKTGRKVTFEYVVWRGINDDVKHARALARYAGRVPSKVNIIEYNPIDEGGFAQAALEKIEMYERILREKDIVVNVRRSRGKDIDAACGQLANKTSVGL